MSDPAVTHMTRGARRAVIYLFAFTVVLAALNLLWTSRETGHVRTQAASIMQVHELQVDGCQAGNIVRAGEITLWVHLAAISAPPPHLTARQLAANRQKVAAFLAYVRQLFAPRNCMAVYKLKGAGQ